MKRTTPAIVNEEADSCSNSQQQLFGTKVIFESLSNRFRTKVLFIQFFVNCLAPFTNCLTNSSAQGFSLIGFKNLNVLYYSLFANFVFFLMIISYCFLKSDDVFIGALYVPLSAFAFHRAMIAVKYSTLTKTEYQKLLYTKDTDLSNLYHTQVQLLTGWLKKAPGIIEFCVFAAGLQSGFSLTDLSFRVPNPAESAHSLQQFRIWKIIMSKCRSAAMVAPGPAAAGDEDEDPNYLLKKYFMAKRSNGSYTACAFKCAMGLIRVADDKCTDWIAAFTLPQHFLTISNIAIPFFAFAGQSTNHLSWSIYSVIFIISSTIINAMFYSTILNFMLTAFVDVARQRVLMATLGDLICPSNLMLAPSMMSMLHSESSPPKDMKVQSFNSEASSQAASLSSGEGLTDGLQMNPLNVTSNKRDQMNESNGAENSDTLKLDFAHVSNRRFSSGKRFNVTSVKYDKLKESVRSVLLDAFDLSEADNDDSDGVTALDLPRLDFRFHENVTNWTMLRTVLLNYGERFRNRINIFVGITICICVVLAGVALAIAIYGNDGNEIAVFRSTYFLQSMLIVSILFLFLIAFTSEATSTNDEMVKHRSRIVAHQMHLRKERDELTAWKMDFAVPKEDTGINNGDARASSIAAKVEHSKGVNNSGTTSPAADESLDGITTSQQPGRLATPGPYRELADSDDDDRPDADIAIVDSTVTSNTALTSGVLYNHFRKIATQEVLYRQLDRQFGSENWTEKCLNRMDEVMGALDQSLTAIDNSNELNPFTVIGMNATSEMTSTILSIAISFYSTIFSSILNAFNAPVV